jgi:hypothetical protein
VCLLIREQRHVLSEKLLKRSRLPAGHSRHYVSDSGGLASSEGGAEIDLYFHVPLRHA